MTITRVLVVGGLSAAIVPLLAGAASAHAVSVATPSGQTHTQLLHAGDGSLPPHSGAFKLHVTCNVNGSNPALTILGPSAC